MKPADDEYEDDVASVPAPPSAAAAGGAAQVITLDRRLMPAVAAIVLALVGGGLYVVQSTRSAMSQSSAAAASVKPPTDDGVSLQLPAAPSPSPSPVLPSPQPRLRPVPTPSVLLLPQQGSAAAPAAEPRTPTPEEAYAEEERRRLLEMRRAPSRVASLDAPDASSSLAADVRRDVGDLDGSRAGSGQNGVPGYLQTTSRYEIRRGTRITTRWVTALDSTLPGGVVVVQVTKTVKDSITGLVPVFPAGTLLTGIMSSSPIAGQARYGIGLDEAELPAPDSRKFYMGEQPGAGRLGESGADVSVDTHSGRQFWNAAIYATIQAGLNLATRASSTVVNLNGSNMGLQPPQQLAPTFHSKPGDELTVTVARDLPLDRFMGNQ